MMRARQESCCFTGHRNEKLPWGDNEYDVRCTALKERIHEAVETAYTNGFRHFICGMAEGCDTYFCEEVMALRARHQEVTVEAAIPCQEQADKWSEEDRERYRDLVDRCDYETVVQNHYTLGCMQRRNRYMVDHASLLIAVHDGQSGGTRNTIEYAFSRQIDVVILPVMVENQG